MNPSCLDKIQEIVLSSSDTKTFYEGFLTAAAEMSHASAGVAWDCSSEPCRSICQIQVKAAPPTQLPISEPDHLALLRKAAERNHASLFQLQTNEPANVVDSPVLIFGPIQRNSKSELVELILPGQNDPEALARILKTLDEYCRLAAKFNESADAVLSGQTTETMSLEHRSFGPLSRDALDQYAHLVHATLDYRQTATTIANEMRRVLDCDRVSVVIGKGSSFKLLAISGQPSVNRRSNTVQRMSRFVGKALATEITFWYPTDGPLPPQIEIPLNEYLEVSATRSLSILPVFDQPQMEDDDPAGTPTRPQVIAGVIVEQCAEQWDRVRVEPTIEITHRHAADALRNALDHRQLFGYWLWRLLGKSRIVTAARNIPKTLAIAGAFALLIGTLTFVPAPFTLHSEGLLLPQTRRKVFAEIDGQVSQIKVLHASKVKQGEALLQLLNTDLSIQLEEVEGQIASLNARLEGNQTVRLGNRFSDDQQLMQENTKTLKSQIESLTLRKATLLAKSGKLKVTSPIDGEIITWDVADRLLDRPVKMGDLLLEVADVAGQWEIELVLPDRRIGHLLKELDKQKRTGAGEGIKVAYRLAADPGATFFGRIKQVAQSTRLNADHEQGVRVIVEIDTQDILAIRQTRSGVSAKIYCGYEPLGYVWFHDVFEFVQSEILFRLW